MSTGDATPRDPVSPTTLRNESHTTITTSVDDIFDLAAPPLQQPLVARLVPVNPEKLQIIGLHEDTVAMVVGRSKELVDECRILTSGKLSAKHCELSVDPITFVVTLKDVSTNGTFVNSIRVPAKQPVALQAGDRVSLTKPVEPSEKKGDGEEGDASTTAVEFIFQRVKDEKTKDTMVDELTCPICKSVYLRPCSVLPCMHVFCASCISMWLRQSRNTCMECRQALREVRPTHKIQKCVDQLLLMHPEYKRSAADIKEMERHDDIPPAGKVVKRPREGSSDDDHHSNFSDENIDSGASDDDYGHGIDLPNVVRNAGMAFHGNAGYHPFAGQGIGVCRQCNNTVDGTGSVATPDGFTCPAGGAHLVCRSCFGPYPDRPLCGVQQRCLLCTGPYCGLYYAEVGGCRADVTGDRFKPLERFQFTQLPVTTFGGNTVEQSILTAYLAREGISMAMVWATCFTNLKDGTWRPDLTSVSGPITGDSALCRQCAEKVLSALLFHYRRAIQADDLPSAVTDRPNCWYGVQCRTQYHKPTHAQNYNHVCYQEKRKE